MRANASFWVRRRGVVVFGGMLAAISGAVSYGVAQNTVVTQAEWVVYMVQALDLDWSLPKNARTKDYVERLHWTGSIEFEASSALAGTSLIRESSGTESYLRAAGVPGEALYRVGTLQAGDYGLRLSLAGGSAMVRMGESVFDVAQPSDAFKWVDINPVSLDPGSHQLTVVAADGAKIRSLALTPPCLRAVEPAAGWQMLSPLRFGDMAASIAKALGLEHKLSETGPAIIIKGEAFVTDLSLPVGDGESGEAPEPFWLSSHDSIVTASARFQVSEPGLYSVEARYLSPENPVRWNVDRCMRVVTCPRSSGRSDSTAVTALELSAGEHDIEVTLPPDAGLDQVIIQRRDNSDAEYVKVVEDAGIPLGTPTAGVKRREAVQAGLRLRDAAKARLASTCGDGIRRLETDARSLAARRAAAAADLVSDVTAASGRATPSVPVGSDPLLPRGSLGSSESSSHGVASPITPR